MAIISSEKLLVRIKESKKGKRYGNQVRKVHHPGCFLASITDAHFAGSFKA